MKKLLLAFGIMLASVFTVSAQTNDAAEKQTTKMVNNLTTACQLTPAQVTKVKPIIQTFVETRIANKQKYAGDAAGMKAANKQNRENMMSQLKTILSADQQAKLKEYMKEKQEKRQQEKEGDEE